MLQVTASAAVHGLDLTVDAILSGNLAGNGCVAAQAEWGLGRLQRLVAQTALLLKICVGSVALELQAGAILCADRPGAECQASPPKNGQTQADDKQGYHAEANRRSIRVLPPHSLPDGRRIKETADPLKKPLKACRSKVGLVSKPNRL